MDSVKQSPLSSFKSKKPLHSPAQSGQKTQKVSDSNPNPNPDPLIVKTPGKPSDAPRRRLRNSGAALSIKDIREAAATLREQRSDQPERPDPEPESEKEHIAKPKKKSAATEIKLPEKYELLDKFFNSLDSSIRLLQIKRSVPIFTKISSQIQRLTDRRFTYSHLAQLKFIMPEAIVVEKELQYDEQTNCMKPDLRITMNVEAIESKGKSKSLTGNLQLRKVFRDRLLDFFKSHPEGDEVPEELLPEPFSRPKKDATANSPQPSATSPIGETRNVAFTGLRVTGSHLPPSFRRSFSQQGGSGRPTEISKQDEKSAVSTHASVHSEDKSAGSHSEEDTSEIVVTAHASVESEDKFAGSHSEEDTSETAGDSHSRLSPKPSGSETCFSYQASLCSKLMSAPPETPVKCIDSVKDGDQCSDGMASVLKTPVANASTPASATPMLQPPKRSCCMTPDDNSFRSPPSKLVRRPPPKRPLKFDTPVKKSVKVDDECGRSGSSSSSDDNILSGALLQSIQEKERLVSMEQEPAISQARWRREMIAKLPKLFNMIYYFFQSIRRSVITKQELIHRLTSELDVVDAREVEEQVRLLQELAPEWIYEKSALSGDLLLCVNKISSPEPIRTRLSEAK